MNPPKTPGQYVEVSKETYDLICARDAALRLAEVAEADSAALRTAIESFLAANTYSTIGSRRAKLRQLVSTDHPGAQLLDELAAAQRWAKLWKRKAKGHRVNFRNTIRMWSALLIKKVRQDEEIAAARKIIAALRQHWNAGGEVWGSIDGDFAAYDAAVKECER